MAIAESIVYITQKLTIHRNCFFKTDSILCARVGVKQGVYMGEDRVAVLLLYHTVFVICMYKHHTILVNSTHAESQTCMKDDLPRRI